MLLHKLGFKMTPRLLEAILYISKLGGGWAYKLVILFLMGIPVKLIDVANDPGSMAVYYVWLFFMCNVMLFIGSIQISRNSWVESHMTTANAIFRALMEVDLLDTDPEKAKAFNEITESLGLSVRMGVIEYDDETGEEKSREIPK